MNEIATNPIGINGERDPTIGVHEGDVFNEIERLRTIDPEEAEKAQREADANFQLWALAGYTGNRARQAILGRRLRELVLKLRERAQQAATSFKGMNKEKSPEALQEKVHDARVLARAKMLTSDVSERSNEWSWLHDSQVILNKALLSVGSTIPQTQEVISGLIEEGRALLHAMNEAWRLPNCSDEKFPYQLLVLSYEIREALRVAASGPPFSDPSVNPIASSNPLS